MLENVDDEHAEGSRFASTLALGGHGSGRSSLCCEKDYPCFPFFRWWTVQLVQEGGEAPEAREYARLHLGTHTAAWRFL